MRIINPSTRMKEEIQGTVFLEYLGQQEDFRFQKSVRKSTLKLEYNEDSKVPEKPYQCNFFLEFDEFFNIPLSLDIMNRSLHMNDELKNNIGGLVLGEVRFENSILIVSGRYYHSSISLAYFEIECVNFECIFQTDQRKNRIFKRTLEILNEYTVELNKKIFIEDE